MKNDILPTTLRTKKMGNWHKQKGVVLFVALIVLVAMSMAGIGMMRAVDAGTQIAGNLAFRQSAIHVQEAALEEAIKRIKLATESGAAADPDKVPGYTNTYQAIDFAAKRLWTNALDLGLDPVTGNTVSILIDRLCDADENCATTRGYQSQAIGASMASTSPIQPFSPHYRVTARVTNSRNMVSFVEEKFY